jgi:hypothetical protein
MTNWEINTKIENLINSNIKEIPYEGTEIDKSNLKEDIIIFIAELDFDDLEKIQKMAQK